MTYPVELWPVLAAAFSGMNDPPGRLRGREAFTHVIGLDWNAGGRATALVELRDFLAKGADEERCRWLMDDMASMYDPLVDFPTHRACVLWVRDQLEAGARSSTI
ncbi:MAG TPA: hypothetical protein VHW92_06285 [Mycobacteriales bacterium]|jgi:hypothetical protein|nr:hypothetical protein [Mycobacteriales bacterium]